MRSHLILCVLVLVLCGVGPALADVFQAGGNRLVAIQNNDGGWDLPLSDGNSKTGSAPNLLAPTAMGLVEAYRASSDPNHLAALKKAGAYLLRKRPQEITPEDGYFAVALDGLVGGKTYADFVKNKYYKPLAAGTYDFFGDGTLLVDTSMYLKLLIYIRKTSDFGNLAALDCGMGLYAAHVIGVDTKPWITATKEALGGIGYDGLYDVLGLAGAVLGLASVGADPYDAATAPKLVDVADRLAKYQLATGGFTWSSKSRKEGAENESVQETAIAVLALNELNRARYLSNITLAGDYLKKCQLPTGGWESFFGQGEFNILTGEALWALGVAKQQEEQKP